MLMTPFAEPAQATLKWLRPGFRSISLENWMSTWHVQLNPTKTQTMLFKHLRVTRKACQSSRNFDLSFWASTLTLQDDITHLKIRFYKTLSFILHMKLTLHRVRVRARVLFFLRGRILGYSPKILIHNYKTFVRPLISYSLPINTDISHFY